jgi:predicted transcriptional regulator
MELQKIISLIQGKLLTAHTADDREIAGAMGADLMSDVLASIEPEAVLLTGLCNPQVVRTAQIADIRAIIFVRGKHPDKETCKIANEENLPLVSTEFGLFEACGILYNAGLASYESTSTDDCSH